MMERLTGLAIPATGVAYGFDRTVEAADQLGLIPTTQKTRALVTIFSQDLQGQSLKVASRLREIGINTELYPDPTAKLDKQFKYADKKSIPFALVIGDEEAKNNAVTLKNLATHEQVTLPIDEVLAKLR
jgi:histidyl-tRNA synthetase